MPRILIIVFMFLSLLGLFNACSQIRSTVDPRIIHKDWTFADVFELEQYILLDSIEPAIGFVDKAVYGNKGQYIYVADKNAGRGVYRFDRQGKYLNRYGAIGDGPGEYRSVNDFTLLNDQSVLILAGRKMIKYAEDSEFIQEVDLAFWAKEVLSFQNQILCTSLLNPDHAEVNWISVYNQNLDLINQFHPYDVRLNQYRFTSWSNLAVSNNRLLVTEIYRPYLTVYENFDRVSNGFKFPNPYEQQFSKLWSVKPFNEAVIKKIKDYSVRFVGIYGYDRGCFLLFNNRKDEKSYPFLYFNDGISFYECPDLQYFDQKGGPFHYIAGSYPGGIIGLVEDPSLIRAFIDQHRGNRTNDFPMAEPENTLLLQFWSVKANLPE